MMYKFYKERVSGRGESMVGTNDLGALPKTRGFVLYIQKDGGREVWWSAQMPTGPMIARYLGANKVTENDWTVNNPMGVRRSENWVVEYGIGRVFEHVSIYEITPYFSYLCLPETLPRPVAREEFPEPSTEKGKS